MGASMNKEVEARLVALSVIVCAMREVFADRPDDLRAVSEAALDRGHATASVAVMREICLALRI
jgi:hypothetical protein